MVSVFPGAAQLIKNQCLSNPASLATEGINQDMTIPLFTTPSSAHPPSSGVADSPPVSLVILQPNHLLYFVLKTPNNNKAPGNGLGITEFWVEVEYLEDGVPPFQPP